MRFKDYLAEETKENISGIFIGRMQGFTVGHMKVIDIMAKTHPHSYVVLVKGEKSSTDTKRNPLPFAVQEKMIKKALPSNVDLTTAKTANLEDILPNLSGKTFAVYAGPDRLASYRTYAKYAIKQGYHVRIIDTGQMIPRDENVSGTKLREALKNNDFEAFKRVAPKEIWDMFGELKKYMVSEESKFFEYIKEAEGKKDKRATASTEGTPFFETLACVGIIADGELISLAKTVSDADRITVFKNKKNTQMAEIANKLLAKIKNSLVGGYDWIPAGVSAIKAIQNDDFQSIRTMSNIIIGMNNFMEDKVKSVIPNPKFISNNIVAYKDADAKLSGKGNKRSTVDCVITNVNHTDLIAALYMKNKRYSTPPNIVPNLPDGYCAIPDKSITFFQVSLKASKKAQLGKISRPIQKLLGLSSPSEYGREIVKFTGGNPPESKAIGRKKKVNEGFVSDFWTYVKSVTSSVWEKIKQTAKSLTGQVNNKIYSFMHGPVEQSYFHDVLDLYGKKVLREAKGQFTKSSSGKALEPLVQSVVNAIVENPAKIMSYINKNMDEAQAAAKGTNIVFMKEKIKPVNKFPEERKQGDIISICLTLVANLALSRMVRAMASNAAKVEQGVAKLMADMLFGSTIMPLWKVYGVTKGMDTTYMYLKTHEVYEKQMPEISVEPFGFSGHPVPPYNCYYTFKALMLEAVDERGKIYIYLRTGTNSSSKLSSVAEGKDEQWGPYDLQKPLAEILQEGKS